MAQVQVTLTFHSGVKRPLFQNVRLSGSWDASGIFSSEWIQLPMLAHQDWSGCDAFSATVALDASQVGTTFQWGVFADLPGSPNAWVIATEVPDPNSSQTTRSFVLDAAGGQVDYWFVTGRRFGAQQYTAPGAAKPGISFSVWAPYAAAVEVVFAPFPAAPATPTGYIDDEGEGIDPAAPVITLARNDPAGTWESNPTTAPGLDDFAAYMNRLYMYGVTNEQGVKTYKVDIFSRNQIGRGDTNTNGAPYADSYLDLDGLVSCSVVSDPDLVTRDFNDTGIDKDVLDSRR